MHFHFLAILHSEKIQWIENDNSQFEETPMFVTIKAPFYENCTIRKIMSLPFCILHTHFLLPDF